MHGPEEWNATEAPFPREQCLHQLVETRAEQQPDAIAVVEGSRRLSYGELDRRANHLAGVLVDRGVDTEECVGICAERSIEYVVGILAILKAGGAYAPIDPTYPQPRIDFIARNTGARSVLVQSRFAEKLPRADYELLPLDADASGLGEARRPPLRTGPDRLAYVIHTSGSTGQPKGVMVEHRCVVNLVQFYLDFHRLSSQDRTTQLMRPGFDASVVEIWPMLAAGGSIHVPEERTFMDPGRLLRWLARERITFCDLPTVLVEALFDQPPVDGLCLRTMITGGDKLRRRPPTWFRWPLYDQYGPTENTVVTTQGRVEPEGSSSAPLHIGRPIANHRVHVLDEARQPVENGEVGELYLGGAGVARGYLNRPEETHERFVPDPFSAEPGARLYRTGDLARADSHGDLEYLGRVDHQVQIRGHRVELAEIERALSGHAAVREALVLWRPEMTRPGLVAYLLAPGSDPAPDLRSFLAARLPHYMVPAHFVAVPAWPLTPNGKIDRNALPPPPPHSATPGPAPRNALEESLVRIFEEELGIAPLGIQEDFFDVGGDSLTAARILVRVESHLERELSLALLFEAPTIEALSDHLRGTRPIAPTTGVVPLQPEGDPAPVFFLPGIGGHALAFRELARALPANSPCFGLQDPAFEGTDAPFASVEAMAKHFVGLISQLSSPGSCALVGYSFGGRVALEMACQLADVGSPPGLVALIDTAAPGFPRKPSLGRRIATHLDNLVQLRGPRRRAYVSERVRNLRRRLRGSADDVYVDEIRHALTPRMRAVIDAHQQAARLHRVRAYEGSVTLLRAAEQGGWPGMDASDPRMGWDEYVSGEIAVREIPGGHLDLLAGPNLPSLASELGEALDAAELFCPSSDRSMSRSSRGT